MGGGGSLLVGRAVPYDGLAGDEGRTIGVCSRFERAGDGFGVVAIDAFDRPAVGLEAFELVRRIGQGDLSIDGDAVVIPQQSELGEPQMAREG